MKCCRHWPPSWRSKYHFMDYKGNCRSQIRLLNGAHNSLGTALSPSISLLSQTQGSLLLVSTDKPPTHRIFNQRISTAHSWQPGVHCSGWPDLPARLVTASINTSQASVPGLFLQQQRSERSPAFLGLLCWNLTPCELVKCFQPLQVSRQSICLAMHVVCCLLWTGCLCKASVL